MILKKPIRKSVFVSQVMKFDISSTKQLMRSFVFWWIQVMGCYQSFTNYLQPLQIHIYTFSLL